MKKYIVTFTFGILVIPLIPAIFLPTPLYGATPAGQLSSADTEEITHLLASIKTYTNNIIAATNTLFTRPTPFVNDLQKLQALKNDITKLNATISPHGSDVMQSILGKLKSLTEHLKEAQFKWVETLQTRSLITLKQNRSVLNRHHEATRRLLLGETRASGGIIAILGQTDSQTLKKEAETILANIDYIFTYGTDSATTKKRLAVFLIQHKGFRPNVSFLPKGFFNL